MNTVEFDATIDDLADANIRIAKRTNTYRQQRHQAQTAYGLVAAGILAVTLQGRSSLAVIIGFTIIGGVVVAYAYGRFHDRYVVRHYRLMVGDLYHGVKTIPCVVDLRDDVVWTKTGDMEIAFPWSRQTIINDVGDSIELWFEPGLVVVRNRAFPTDDDRLAFLRAATRLCSQKAV